MSTAHTSRSSGGNGLGREQQETLGTAVTRKIRLRRFDPTEIRHVARAALDQAAHLMPSWLPEGRREGQEWVALNPTRSDARPGSFKVNLVTGIWADFATGDKGADLVALHAYLKGIKQDEAGWLLAEDLAITGYDHSSRRERSNKTHWTSITPVPDAAPPPPKVHYKRGKPACIWTYRDVRGAVLCHVYRFDSQDGKEILPLSFCRDSGTGKITWRWQGLALPRPLYNLDKLAANPTAVVILCEGEKAADAAAVLFPKCVTTTTLNGAQSPHKTDFSPLQSRIVWIWPDNDLPGCKYAEQVRARLESIAREGKLLHPSGNHTEGWDAADALEEGWQPDQGYELQAAPEPSPDLNAGLAECFKVQESGVWYHPPADPGGESKPPVWICSALKVTAYTRNSDGEAWGRLLEFKDAEGKPHSWPMPVRLLQMDGSEFRATLADMGLVIASGRKARDLLTTYIQAARPAAWVRCVLRTGWHGGTFVFPDETIGETSGERVLLQTDNNRRHVYHQAGTLADWQREVTALCVENSRLTFAVSCAFASLLLLHIGDENGGFHFQGSSSIGKSTLLCVASSVFGGSDYMQGWRATANGLEAVAAQHNDSLLCLDEIKQVDPKEAGEIAYMLGNGNGKNRADRAGFARARQTWRLLFLSSGELSLEEHLSTVGKRVYAGEETRLADIPADTMRHGAFEALHGHTSGEAFARALKAATQRYHGTAAREFVRRLTALDTDGRFAEKLRSGFEELRREFMAYHVPEGASGQVQRVAMRFALVGAGGDLATRLGITGWVQGEAVKAAVACFNAWLDARGGVGDREILAALSQVRRFFELHGESRFTPWDTTLAGDFRTVNRAGFRRVNEQGETVFYVLREVFRTEICSGRNWHLVARALVERGLIIPDEKGRSTRNERLPGLGNVRCYRFNARVLQDA